jgi:hypothetical protein
LSEVPGLVAAVERDLLARVAAWPEYRSWTELTQPLLARLSAAQGSDFATALLYDRLRSSERHGPFIRRLDELITNPPQVPGKMDVLLAVVPGAFYRELPGRGADGRLLRQRVAAHGCRTALIPTCSTGTVAENGRIICDWLAEHPHDRIILASLSKGAADVKAALASGAAEAFQPVRAWINLSGMPGGIPLTNWLLGHKVAKLLYKVFFWWKGMDFELVRQLEWGPGSVLDFPLEVPPHVLLINVTGFPLRRHLTSKALARFQQRIAEMGPSDGLVLLSDVAALPGLTYPVWGADHNLRPAWDVRRLVAALTTYLADALNLWMAPWAPLR